MSVSDNLAAVIVGGLFMLIPIIAILTRHQIKMTQLLNQNNRVPTDDVVLHELGRLRELVTQQALIIDSLATSQKELTQEIRKSETLRERLNA